MKISKIKLRNFRIYKGDVELDLSAKDDRNISIIAGKNGFGKTTFLTSLIWCFYGNLMVQVEEKYRKDIQTIGGYNNYLLSLLNRDIDVDSEDAILSVEIELEDIMIPSIPCKTVQIRRTFNANTKEEKLEVFIDGDENELTKDFGFEIFINDFILPREIAKFFFFDAEKIVSLAEAKSRVELRTLSRAYSEVLGIKKYEELKHNLESLLVKLRRRGVSDFQKSELDRLIDYEHELEKTISHNEEKQGNIDKQIVLLRSQSDSLQEKLIREGNEITLEELKELKGTRDELKAESIKIKQQLRKLLELAPFVIAGKKLADFNKQLQIENEDLFSLMTPELLRKELELFSNSILNNSELLSLDNSIQEQIKNIFDSSIQSKFDGKKAELTTRKIYLDFNEELFRKFKAIYKNIQTTYISQFNAIVKEERGNRALWNRAASKIKQAEARKDNHLVKRYREEKVQTDSEIQRFTDSKANLLEEIGALKSQLTTHRKKRSEYEKKFNLVETDKKKYAVTENLLEKINILIRRIKEDKKYSLQKSVSLGLKRLMHKDDFISNVRVNIEDDVMDIDLLDMKGNVIDKDSLSKGEQQLYATALLKALVDESGIKFPVFIDSPLQKFDKFHSINIIKEFYPSISEQVVLFPLLEKELSEKEFDYLKPHLHKTFLINNSGEGSRINSIPVNDLFKEFKKEENVYTH